MAATGAVGTGGGPPAPSRVAATPVAIVAGGGAAPAGSRGGCRAPPPPPPPPGGAAPGPAPSKMSVRVPMSGSGAGLSSSAGLSRPVALPASDSPTDLKRPEALASTPAMARPGSAESAAALLEMAAAGELMRRLRRASSLGKDDRDRLIKRVETELEDMVEALGSQRLDRAIAALGDRLGIPVPPRSDLSSSGIFPVARPAGESPAARLLPTPRAAAQPDGNPRSGESADYQWAFDLIEDLRADNVEPEGSSGK